MPYLKALSGRLVAVDSTSDSTLRKGRPRSGKGKKKSGASKEDQEERSEGTTPKGSPGGTPQGTPQDSELGTIWFD